MVIHPLVSAFTFGAVCWSWRVQIQWHCICQGDW